MKLFLLAIFTAVSPVVAESARRADWQLVVEHVADGKSHGASLWTPSGETPRALIVAVDNFAEPQFCLDPAVRAFCLEERFGIVLVKGNPFGSHDPPDPPWLLLDGMLHTLESRSGIAGLASLPLIPFGHSAAGPWARNLAFHQPRRVAAVIYFKSGQFQPPAWAQAGGFRVPVLAINGQYEEFGPRGDHQPGDDWQSQWRTMRDQLAALRAKGMQVALTVEPGGGHYAWSGRQLPVLTAYLRAVSNAIGEGPGPDGFHRYPNAFLANNQADNPEDSGITRESGFRGTPAETWWFPDRATAEAWRDSLAGMNQKRQYVRFQHVTESRGERDVIDPAKVFETDGVHFRVEALSEIGQPVSYAVLTGPAEHLGGGAVSSRPPRHCGFAAQGPASRLVRR